MMLLNNVPSMSQNIHGLNLFHMMLLKKFVIISTTIHRLNKDCTMSCEALKYFSNKDNKDITMVYDYLEMFSILLQNVHILESSHVFLKYQGISDAVHSRK